nr:MAG TPA: hypothetical protein [Caudoviricetes sp.]
MFYRCELLIDGLRYRVTDDLENWDEVKASFKRNDYDGVIRTFSNKFSFAGDARRLLLKQYDEDYLNASASIIISTRNNSWLYNERFSCALNFSTLQDNGSILQINAVDDSVASMIKAKRGTQYEYPVEEVKSPIPLVYDGLELFCTAEWIITGSRYDTENDEGLYLAFNDSTKPSYITIYIKSSDALINRGSFFDDVSDTSPLNVDSDGNITDLQKDQLPFFENIEGGVSVTLDIYVEFKVRWLDTNGKVSLAKRSNGKLVYIKEVSLAGTSFTAFEYNGTVSLHEGDALFLLFRSDRAYNELQVNEDNIKIHASWKNRINPVEMDVVNPSTLLNRLLKSINGGKDGLTGVIESMGDGRLDNCMLLAAESARKIPGAKIYTSFTKFASWMSYVFGYAYDISGNTITFRHRGKYFSDDVVKKIDDLSDYEMKVNSALVYSRIRIGFDKQDYDTANGKDEFRFTNEYTTGVTMTDNSLEMISPYRADAYGIEFLADKIGEDTTDNESDTDLFMVGVKSDSSGLKYILNRDYLMGGVLSPDTMFNAMFSPSSMVLANEAYIGSSVEMLTFASSDGNSDVGIDGMGESRDIILSKRMFTVAEVEFETSDVELPEDLTGIVEFEHQGKVIQGYYQQADYNFTKSQSSKVTLIVKNSNSL